MKNDNVKLGERYMYELLLLIVNCLKLKGREK